MAGIFQGVVEDKKYVFVSIALGVLFWLVQFAYQYYINIPGKMDASVVSSAAFTAATLIGIALLIGPFARIFPSKNYIRHRRTFGVLGFTFAVVHVISVIFYYNFGISSFFTDLNPFANPILFGLLAFTLYIPMYLTSTDWALEKLGFKRWKTIHRIVYFAWILTVLHFISVNPSMLSNAAGYLLLAITALVFIFELAAFIKHSVERGGRGRYIGSLIIALGIVLFFLAYYFNQNIIALAIIPIVLIGGFVLYVITRGKRDI